ncbi:SufS family cysteine desulfurase [Thalassotalea sp. G2M2-11]|uniref:SufS family cysteine desulfurase n=1 Tax=Thalassotalea sp. G2M2-11 TaxID=2787627 RepID=UPI0019D31328|nr:SufS family cysteine desulfurase [Thalassotalea sp. G2M2-11]
MKTFDVNQFRQYFPILTTTFEQYHLVYFDNAATMQKPLSVIDAEHDYYLTYNANVHRGSHYLSQRATELFEQARVEVQRFINARSVKEIIWTKGTTESINLVAQSWGLEQLQAGDEIVLSYAEHHANIVPWQVVAEKVGANIKVLPLNESGVIDVHQLDSHITEKTKIVCCSHLSNVIGKFNPIETIITKAKSVGALTLIDGAQAIANTEVNVQQLDCDFYVFSAHKLYGPTGVGVLYGKQALLAQMSPYQFGGEMIKKVSFAGTTFNELPFKFEAGTPNIAGCIAFTEAIKFILSQNLEQQLTYKKTLTAYCYQQLAQIGSVQFLVKQCPDIPLFSFNLSGFHQQDVAAALDSKGVAVRAGHHCAMPLMDYLAINGCLRVSLAAYNTFDEVDYLVNCLKALILESQTTQTVPLVANTQESHASDDDIEYMVSIFSQQQSWDSKHRHLMLLGKNFHRMDKSLRTEQRLVAGCESEAWLDISKNADGRYLLQGDSDAKIIRGLMKITFAAFNNKTAEQIQHFDIQAYFEKLGLLSHLSPSRGNGLLAIVEKIKLSVS